MIFLFALFLKNSWACEPMILIPGESGVDDIGKIIEFFPNERNLEFRGRELEFTYSAIEVAGNTISFEDPLLDGRLILHGELVCTKKEPNWLGIEICQEHKMVSNTREFCRKLGYYPTKENVFQKYNSSRISTYYSISDGEWNINNTHSMLAGNYKIKMIKKLTCSYVEDFSE